MLAFAGFGLFITVGPIIPSRAALGKDVPANCRQIDSGVGPVSGPVSDLQLKLPLLWSTLRNPWLWAAGDLRITRFAADNRRVWQFQPLRTN